MNFFLSLFLAMFVWLGVDYAQAESPIMVQGVDVSPLIKALNDETSTVITPFKIFHYFHGWGEYVEAYPSTDARGFRYVQYNAAQYLKQLGSPKTAAVYGTGLYAAADPLTSRDYGRDANWVLAEIQIPRGFRFINFHHLSSFQFSKEVKDVLTKFQCQFMDYVGDLFRPNNYRSPLCAAGLREVFQQARLDGFMYPYIAYDLTACSVNIPDHSMAIVLMSNQWLKPEMVRLYNAESRDDKDERKYLESSLFRSAINYSASMTYPTSIDRNKLNTIFGYATSYQCEWMDLEGEATNSAAEIDAWIQNNLFGCTSSEQYSKPGVTP